jgi:DNA-binding Lrp family transcriptional regulator
MSTASQALYRELKSHKCKYKSKNRLILMGALRGASRAGTETPVELNAILVEAPGMPRRFVYYLEARGFIQPEKVWKRRIARREYSTSDAAVVRETWRYYQRGFSVRSAYEMATRREKYAAWVRLRAAPRKTADLVWGLREVESVREAGAVHGAEEAVLLVVEAPEEAELYGTMAPLMAKWGVPGVPAIAIAKRGAALLSAEHKGTGGKTRGEGGMIAYIMLTVPGTHPQEVLGQLKRHPQVKEAAVVYGEADIVARVVTGDQAELDSLVMDTIHGIPDVESTRTYIVVKDMHWSR